MHFVKKWGVLIILSVVALIVAGLLFNNWRTRRIDPSTPQAHATTCPQDRLIKGNAQSGIYHMPGGQFYARTRPERCFSTEAEAKKAGYRKSMK